MTIKSSLKGGSVMSAIITPVVVATSPECGPRLASTITSVSAACNVEPLTLTDAKHEATVDRWLNQWLTTTPAWTTPLVSNPRYVLRVSVLPSGTLYSRTYWNGAPQVETDHADRAALVAYVVAWARSQH